MGDSIACEIENGDEDIDIQIVAAPTREVDRRSIRRVIINARDIGAAPELLWDHLGFGFYAEKICVDCLVGPFDGGSLIL
jgi:hypothetical protein